MKKQQVLPSQHHMPAITSQNLKKYLFFIFISLSLTFPTQAQNFGLKAGTTIAKMRYTQKDGDNMPINGSFIPGVQLAAFKSFPLLEKFLYLQVELGYIGRGTKISRKNHSWQQVDYSHAIHYINLPVMLRIGSDKFGMEAGPELAYLIASNVQVDNKPSPPRFLNTRQIDYGINAGLYYQLPANLLLNVSYYHGLENEVEYLSVWDDKGNRHVYNTRNQSFSLALEYRFK